MPASRSTRTLPQLRYRCYQVLFVPAIKPFCLCCLLSKLAPVGLTLLTWLFLAATLTRHPTTSRSPVRRPHTTPPWSCHPDQVVLLPLVACELAFVALGSFTPQTRHLRQSQPRPTAASPRLNQSCCSRSTWSPAPHPTALTSLSVLHSFSSLLYIRYCNDDLSLKPRRLSQC